MSTEDTWIDCNSKLGAEMACGAGWSKKAIAVFDGVTECLCVPDVPVPPNLCTYQRQKKNVQCAQGSGSAHTKVVVSNGNCYLKCQNWISTPWVMILGIVLCILCVFILFRYFSNKHAPQSVIPTGNNLSNPQSIIPTGNNLSNPQSVIPTGNNLSNPQNI